MIGSFTGEYRFLSNFWPCYIVYEDLEYQSVENAYQALKCQNKCEREKFINITPGKAKKLGNLIQKRMDWEFVKDIIMFDLCYQKFIKDDLRQKLLDTGNEELIEGNTWDDTYWGVCNGVGQNRLGKILMRIRQNLKEDQMNSESCIFCNDEVKDEDFKSDLNRREFIITKMCQKCQDKLQKYAEEHND